MNALSTEKKTLAVSMLCEGSSIRAIERVTGIHRDTIMRLGVRMGEACAKIQDEKFRNLNCANIECDEIWGRITRCACSLRSWNYRQSIPRKLRPSLKIVALGLIIPLLYIASTGPILFLWDKTALGYNAKFASFSSVYLSPVFGFAFESKTYPAKVLRAYWWCFRIAVLEPREDSN